MSVSLSIETRHFINGEFVPSLDGSTFKLFNPWNNNITAEVSEAKAADVDRAVDSAKAAFPNWSSLDGSERRRLMLRLADLVDENTSEFARLEALSMGKPVSQYMDSTMGTATLRYECTIDDYAGKALDVHGVTSLTSQNHLNLSLRQPYGVTAAIIPWNVPLIMLCFKVGPSLIAGNTLIVKSSEKAPLTCLLFARLAHEAGFPPGVLNFLSGFGLPCGDAIARHPIIRKIAFTGSSMTGKLIQKAAAESNLKSCTLELGGKSPLLIFEDANLEKAAKAAAFSIVFNSGQVCMASSRIYVQDSIAQEFTQLYLKEIQAISNKAGDPLGPETNFGPQADTQQVQNIQKFLNRARIENFKAILDDNADPSQGNFVSPRVFIDVPEESPIMKEEIFGAVSCINRFKDEADALERANDSEFGLYATVFTHDLNRAIRITKNFEAGSVAVNCSSPYYCQDLPLGGSEGSGTGRELGQEGLDSWTEVKSIFVSLD
ncbi:uncharacterized protein N7483_009913 [Penicillium malachiteum]|uniref:uncharacterized protein n=1 Tax=Penicillium malachiteum TaxID=1324776 RepID=UPI002547B8F8|nr:uncharacterized protein N7483_009913 [Penicillium malachiteum]KAJ5718831.1 hypothetical protein N7483_009913 [Penicillium malachiteum]